jgi:Fe2+ or Zn2+ uptake regulation protein
MIDTPNRAAIRTVLRNAKRPLSRDEIFEAANNIYKHPSKTCSRKPMARSTVLRNLRTFRNMGLIKATMGIDKIMRFKLI